MDGKGQMNQLSARRDDDNDDVYISLSTFLHFFAQITSVYKSILDLWSQNRYLLN